MLVLADILLLLMSIETCAIQQVQNVTMLH
jgi:hypothetical protein